MSIMKALLFLKLALILRIGEELFNYMCMKLVPLNDHVTWATSECMVRENISSNQLNSKQHVQYSLMCVCTMYIYDMSCMHVHV